MTAMIRESKRQRRRQSRPPKEGILSNVVGEFLDPIDALFTIFYGILFALVFTLSYGVLIYRGVISSSFAGGYGQELFFTILGAVTAWGIIEGVVYVVSEVLARRERYRLLQYVQTSDNHQGAAACALSRHSCLSGPGATAAHRRQARGCDWCAGNLGPVCLGRSTISAATVDAA
jgi:hypothetical protein